MGTTTYLRVGIDGTGAQMGARVVTRSLSDISNQANSTHSSMQHLRNTLLGFGGAAVGIYGIATAFQKLKEALVGVLDYMGRIETETLGIAASFTTGGRFVETITGKVLQGQSALSAAMTVSKGVIDQLRVANFNTIATLDQLIYAYQVTLPVAMGKGFDKSKVMDFTVAMVQAAGAIGLPFDQIAEETRTMLTGNITRNSRIAQVLGIRPEDIHAIKGDTEALFSFLMGRLSGFKEAGIESQKTWAGLWSNFKDAAQQALSISFEPMFVEVKRGLKSMIDYMGTVDAEGKKFNWNPEVLEGLKDLKESLKSVLSFVKETISFFNKYGDAIITIVKAYVGYKLAVAANVLVQKAMNSELMQTIALQIKVAQGKASPFGRVSVNNGMHGDGSTVISGDVAGMNKYKRAANAEASLAAANAIKAEATAARELTAAKLAETKAKLAANAAEQESIRTSMQSLSSTQAATTASQVKLELKVQEAAIEVASLTAVRNSIEAERALIVTKMQGLDTDAATLALQEKKLVSKQANRAATVAEIQATLAQKQALIAKWESELFFEGRSLTQSTGLNLVKEQEVNLRRSLSAHTRQAAIEEAALEGIRNQSLATDIAKTKAINELVPLAKQQNGIERQLSLAVATHNALEVKAGSALTERGVAARQLVVAEIAQTGIEKQLAAATAATTIATANEQVATNAATAAKLRSVEANAALTLSSRLAAGAMGVLRGAMAALGGPVMTVITLLGIVAMAWFHYGNKAEEANKKALNDADDVLKSLQDQIDKIHERDRLMSKSNYKPSVDLKDRALTDSSLGLRDNELAAIETYKKELNALDLKLSQMIDQNIGFELSDKDKNRYKDLENNIQTIINARLKLNFIEKERAEPEYKANERVDAEQAERLGALRKYLDAQLALQKANSEKKIAGYKEDAARDLSILTDKHDNGLIATTEFYRRKQKIEEKSIQHEIDANNDLIKHLQSSKLDAFSVKEDPTGKKAAAARLEQQAQLVAAQTKGIELSAQLRNVSVDTDIAIGRSNRELIDQKDQLNQQVLHLQGDTLGAGLAELNNQKARLDMAVAERESLEANLNGDKARQDVAKENLELLKQTKKLKEDQLRLDEMSKQIAPQADLLNAQGEVVAALALNQALEQQSAAYKDLAAKGGAAFQAKQKLMELDRIKARQDEENALNAIKYQNMVDSADLKAASSTSGKGFGFSAITDQMEADKVAITAKYDLERKAIEDKIELLQSSSTVELDMVSIVRDAQLAAIDTVHQATMAAIAAENEARYFNQPTLLTQAKDASIAAELAYQNKLESSTKASDAKIASAKIASNKNTTAMISALRESLTLMIGRQEQELLAVEKKATTSKMTLAADYVNTVAGLFTALADTQDQSSRKGFETAKQYNMAAAVMSTAAAIVNALATVTPYPAAVIAAASAAAIGAVQIAKISSTSFGGGGSVATVSAGSFGSGGSSSGSKVGSSIGAQVKSTSDLQTEESLRTLAQASDNASMAITKVADGLTRIADLFTTGYSKNVGKSLVTAEGDFEKGVFSQTWKDMKDNFGIAVVDNLFGGMTAAIAVGASLIRHAFGIGNKWRTTGSGISLGLEDGSLDGQSYINRKKDGGWFGSDKKKTIYSDLDAGLEDVFVGYLNDIKNSISRSAVVLGTQTDFSSAQLDSKKISTAGRKPEDIQKDLEEFYTNAANQLAKTTEGLEEFAFYGENAFDAIIRLSTSLQGVNGMFDLVGQTLIESSLAGADAAYRLADAFGGLEDMKSAVDDYFTSMFTEFEQKAMKAAAASREVSAAFNEMGISVPQTNLEFRKLVEGLDVTTSVGASLYVELIKIAPAFATMTEAAEEAAEKIRTSFIDNALSAAQALKEIMSGELSTGSPETLYRDTLKSFQNAQATGDDARLAELGRSLLEASRAYNGSSAAYMADFQTVTQALANVAGMNDSPTLVAANKQVQLLTDIKEALEENNPIDILNLISQINPWTDIGRGLGSPVPSAPTPQPYLNSEAQSSNYNTTVDTTSMEEKLERMIVLMADMAARLETLETNSRLAVNQ